MTKYTAVVMHIKIMQMCNWLQCNLVRIGDVSVAVDVDQHYLCYVKQGCGVGVRVLAWSRSLSFEEDSDSGPYLSHPHFDVILLQSI